ncbi:aminotransferase [Planomicrobium sp. HSC-17F08]|uniref:Pyridoxal phosphate-dependent aminotransferase n=1 Tax=Planococcus glaciei TaxID=459472 RepID=A0A1G7WDI8_9BACL|nr:pyridoxal phosphate-dependent aminotransferase [Planococcus glaciei]ETP69156.1 diaminopimelate aminotransferase [Planococcus glaciei CHR43]MCP2033982.1 aminotransferase [Planomicrobium sp. HSC-17F08]QKX49906.1 pyridoxal phosphate-dependent aminotransferase [Planococcus glaciei]SDG69879.1 aminotransferase [Planococcus glaciei]
MEFSNRLQQLPTQFFSKLAAKTSQALAEGRDIINLGQGNPDQPTPEHIIKAMQEAVADPKNHKYSPFRGIPEMRQAAADFYKREYGVDIDPDTEVAVLAGTKIGLVELPLVFLNPGELMLLPDPGYPDYLSGTPLAEARFETFPLKAENGFLPDYAEIPHEAKEQAKLMYLNYPNNPTGAVATPRFFEETVAFAKENELAVVHDFAYGAVGFDGIKPPSFLQTDGAKEVGVEMYTLSKTYNMAGWRIGFAVGNPKMIEGLNLIQDHLFAGLSPALQLAAVEALTGDQRCVNELVGMYERRRTVLKEECARIGWKIEAPKGSFFAWLPVPKGFTSVEFADYLLEHANISTAAGSGFGESGEGYIRVGLLVDEARIAEAISRVEKLKLF